MDCSLPGTSVHGIFQARMLEWGAIAFDGHEVVLAEAEPRGGGAGGADSGNKPGRGEIATQHFKLQALPSPLFTARLFLPTEAFAHKTKWVIQRERKSPRK